MEPAPDPFAFEFAGEWWRATPEGALFWPRHRILLVADLHLEKASWYARHGQPLPPYDSRATLASLGAIAARLDPREIWCLGDSFHDRDGQARIDPAAEALLLRLAARHRWLFIAGNHDGLPDGRWGTSSVDVLTHGGLVFRHEHDPDDPRPQLSGHYHPKASVALRGRHVRRPCFACGESALILPAFGSLTGGLDIDDPAIARLFTGPYAALVPTAQGIATFPRAPVAKMSHIRE
ncbi:MAG: ligase-associated DNA damage response endonuclease PdeM [Sphingopyxis sp.]|nr:ligase-associated DNA damage response endonuclease PdeM [Sphingopyxis sp.]